MKSALLKPCSKPDQMVMGIMSNWEGFFMWPIVATSKEQPVAFEDFSTGPLKIRVV